MGLPNPIATALQVVEEIRSVERPAPLEAYRSALLTAIGELVADGVDVLEITQLVARVNDALTTRLLEVAERRAGSPPTRYAWLALGSHGRGEQVLSSDQDSALAYDDPRAGRDDDAGHYFRHLAAVVVPALARAGMPLCPGGYMATNWCHPMSTFRRMFSAWVDEPVPVALLEGEVFLDVRSVHGGLSVDQLSHILVVGGSRGSFLAQMARAAVTFRPHLNVFGRLSAKSTTIDVKRDAIAAIVLLARLYALAAGSGVGTTVRRLEAAAAAGTITDVTAAELTEAYRFLTGLRLRHQLEQARRGEPADNNVRLDTMHASERRRLTETLRTVRDVQNLTASRFATHTTM
jgi:CBS domain-containing protein